MFSTPLEAHHAGRRLLRSQQTLRVTVPALDGYGLAVTADHVSFFSVLHLRFDSRFRDRSAANLWRVLSPVLASQPLFLGSLDRSVQR